MALVPYRVSGAAADQTLDTRLFQIGGHTLTIVQDPKRSASLSTLLRPSSDAPASQELDRSMSHPSASRAGPAAGASDPSTQLAEPLEQLTTTARRDAPANGQLASPQPGTSAAPPHEQLDHVGLVVWQSAFVLAEYLLQRPPFGGWSDVRAVDLGSGTGVTGIALALAGADVLLTDLPHVTHLTQRNVDANCSHPGIGAQVADYAWGSPIAALGRKPDLITGADVVYQQEHFDALIDTICQLSDSHTLTYLAFRQRGRKEDVFEAMLEAAGLAVVAIPMQYLHEEYRSGVYRLLRICKLGP